MWRRLIGLSLAAAILLGLAAAWLLPGRLDPALVRAALERAATERLASTVAIDGPVRFALLPRPVIEAARVSFLHGSPGDADALAVTADLLTARLDLSELWRGRLAAADLALDGAQVQAPLPFDIRLLTAGRPASLGASAIALTHARLLIGPFVAEQVDARFATDPLTGDATLAGTFRLRGGSAWRAAMRLSRPGGDGSAAFDASAAEIYAADGATASLSGQIAGDGGFAGRIAAAGPNLAHLVAAPSAPFTASGRVSLAGGAAALDDVAITLDGAPSRLDATLRLPPQPRIDLKLVASRLDLDAWRHALAAAPLAEAGLPIDLDLAAESAILAGGALRQVRANLALDGARLTLREVEAIAPGDMTARMEGEIDLAAATCRAGLRLEGANLRATAAWLGAASGLAAADGAPDMFRSLAGRATLETAGSEVELHDIAATLDGVGLRGDVLLSLHPGTGDPNTGSPRPAAAAILALDRLDVTPWLSWSRQGGQTQGGQIWPWPGLDASLQLATPHASFPGVETASLDADVSVRDGAVDVRRLKLGAPHWDLGASGGRSAAGAWSDVTVAMTADRAAAVAPLLPAAWREIMQRRPRFWEQPGQILLQAAGTAAAPSGSLSADLGDLHLEASARAGASAGAVRGDVSIRHPDARGLAAALGVPLDFLGAGGLAISAGTAWESGAAAVEGLRVQAGLLDAGGQLRLDVAVDPPTLTGRLDAAALPSPDFTWRSTAPLPWGLLTGYAASLDLTAAHVFGGLQASNLQAHIGVADGALDVADLSASLASGGLVAGRIGLNAAASPPIATSELSLSGVRLGAQPWRPLDLRAGDMAVTVRLAGHGYAPAAWLATLHGTVEATANAASLFGVDVSGLGGDLSDATVRAALAGGRTLLDAVRLSLDVDKGLATLRAEATASGGARIGASGSIDLPDATLDLGLSIMPAISDPPDIGLRVSGDAAGATATPALGKLDRWRAIQP